MISSTEHSVLFVSIGRGMKSLRIATHRFAHEILYVICTNTKESHDKRMTDDLEENQRNVRFSYPEAKFIVLSMYDFFKNVAILRSYFQKHNNMQMICDITGGDKIITLAIIYARILESENADIGIYYQKREEDITKEFLRFIQIPNLPSLTKKQHEFMKALEDSKTIDEIMNLTNTSINNIWNYTSQLQDLQLIEVDKEKRIIISKLPFNYYAVSNIEEISSITKDILSEIQHLSEKERKYIINKLKNEDD